MNNEEYYYEPFFSNDKNFDVICEDDYNNKSELNLSDKMNDSNDSEESNEFNDMNITRCNKIFEQFRSVQPYKNYYYNDSLNYDKISKNDFQMFCNKSNQPTDDSEKELKVEFSICNEITEKNENLHEKERKNNLKKEEKNKENVKENNVSNILFLQEKRKAKKEKYFYIYKVTKKTNVGRKKKKDPIKGIHNKLKADNIINKIKGFFVNYNLKDVIKKNSIEKIDLIKVNHGFIEDLSKDKNEILFSKKIKDILREEKITSKNKNYHKYANRFLIDKIYKQEKEKKVIKILELTFRELFIIFRRKLNCQKDREALEIIKEKIKGLDLLENDNYKDIGYFINEIENKEKKNKDIIYTEDDENESEKYIEEIKNLCCNYEEWFNAKKGRKGKKQK